jgi:hypothetical protein
MIERSKQTGVDADSDEGKIKIGDFVQDMATGRIGEDLNLGGKLFGIPESGVAEPIGPLGGLSRKELSACIEARYSFLLMFAHRSVTDKLKPFVDRWQHQVIGFKS